VRRRRGAGPGARRVGNELSELQPQLLVHSGRESVEEEGAPGGKDAAVHADSGNAPREDDLGVLTQSRKAGSSKRSRLSLRRRRLTASSSTSMARGGGTATKIGGDGGLQEEDSGGGRGEGGYGGRRRCTEEQREMGVIGGMVDGGLAHPRAASRHRPGSSGGGDEPGGQEAAGGGILGERTTASLGGGVGERWDWRTAASFGLLHSVCLSHPMQIALFRWLACLMSNWSRTVVDGGHFCLYPPIAGDSLRKQTNSAKPGMAIAELATTSG
jgi:hypothetical protein